MKRILLLTFIALGLFGTLSCVKATTTTEKSLAGCDGSPYQDDPSLPAWQDAWFKANTSLTFGSYCVDSCNDSAEWQALVSSPGCVTAAGVPIKCSCADELSPVQDTALLAKCQGLLAACVAAKAKNCSC